MGFVVPDLTGEARSPLAPGKWEAEFVKFVSGNNQVGDKEFVQPVWKVTDDDAVDTSGEPFKRQVWADKFWLTKAAGWRLGKFAKEAGVELPATGEKFESVADYAAELTEAFAGLDGVLVTDLRVHQEDTELPVEEQRRYTEVTGYEF